MSRVALTNATLFAINEENESDWSCQHKLEGCSVTRPHSTKGVACKTGSLCDNPTSISYCSSKESKVKWGYSIGGVILTDMCGKCGSDDVKCNPV